MTTNEATKLIGQRVTFTGGKVAASVVVVDVRERFGRTDYQVEDCTGVKTWVDSVNCKASESEKGER